MLSPPSCQPIRKANGEESLTSIVARQFLKESAVGTRSCIASVEGEARSLQGWVHRGQGRERKEVGAMARSSSRD